MKPPCSATKTPNIQYTKFANLMNYYYAIASYLPVGSAPHMALPAGMCRNRD
jgi:hypothetical protein